jgi:ligand-binding sensor domain-containing protein
LSFSTVIKVNFMRKTGFLQNFETFAGILLSIMIFISCERTDYELLDPESAGVWTLFDTSDGLPGNCVEDIRKDRNGNLWMTFPGQGIAKYSDGVWTYYKAVTSPLLSNTVRCIAETSDGSLIFGTSTGLSILSETNTWDSYVDPVTTMSVTAIKVASDGKVWVGTADQGFYVDSGSGFIKTFSEIYKNINVIEEDASGNIWIGTDNGLIKWNGTSYTYLSLLNGLPDNKISSLRRDSKKRLWIGTRFGKTVSWIDRKGMHQLSLLNGRDTCSINDIFEDRSGDIWFATAYDGLIKYDGIIPISIRENDGLPENKIRSIGEDKYGSLWFGLESKGVVRYTLPIN